jgi:hypothetical protein
MFSRRLKALILISVPLFFTGCIISRPVKVPQLVTPVSNATIDELLSRIRDLQKFRTISARVSLQFQVEEAEYGLAERYRSATGLLALARPASVYLDIMGPFKINVAKMASDGQQFQVMVYPEDHRMFLQGSNYKEYSTNEQMLEKDPKWRTTWGLRNVRPQHFTEAYLLDTSDAPGAQLRVSKQEERRTEEERQPGQKPRLVIRSYYTLSFLELDGENRATVRRRFWFDRTRGLLLVRQEIYGDGGEIRSEINYKEFAADPASQQIVPIVTEIHRPYDHYSVRLDLDRTTLLVNNEFPAEAFRLTLPAEWGNGVKVINLDKKTP